MAERGRERVQRFACSLVPSGTRSQIWLRFGWAVLAGTLLASSFPPIKLPILFPFGVAPLLVAVESAKIRHAFYAGFICGLVFYGATLHWLGNLFGAASISLIAIAAFFPALFCALYV